MPIQQLMHGMPSKGPYIDYLFSTYLFKGNSSSQTITNGIDLSGRGGLVWSKTRGVGDNHRFTDTVRGVNKSLSSDLTSAEYTTSGVQGVSQFNSNGFASGLSDSFYNNDDISSWTFRKAPGFFDVVTFEESTAGDQTISHSLQSIPGMIIFKRTDSTGTWYVWHRSVPLEHGYLNGSNAFSNNGGDGNPPQTIIDDVTATSFDVKFGTIGSVIGADYVGYVFAHDEQSFGKTANDSVIKCGEFTSDGSGNATVNLGWEPSFVIMKRVDGGAGWYMFDSMRGFPAKTVNVAIDPSERLSSNASDAGSDMSNYNVVSGSGFSVNAINTSSRHIYIAIRRPDSKVGKPPIVATDVFSMVTGVASDTIPAFASGFPVDMGMYRKPGSTSAWSLNLRLMGGKGISPNQAIAESNNNAQWDNNSRFGPTDATQYNSDYQAWFWKRYSGFTTVCYTGDGSSNRQITHDMNNDVEMMWIKNRELGTGGSARNWVVYHKGLNGGTNPAHYYVPLNHDFIQINEDTIFNDTEPTSTNFTVGGNDKVNTNNINYAAMLFGSVNGISKVGYFDGLASTISITVGFQPRFLIVRRITGSADADWHVFDTLRGWGTANAYNLHLNGSDNHHNQSNISTLTSTGFTLTNNAQWNGDGEKYIYYAHA